MNNGNNHDNISLDNSEIQSLDEKQKMLLLKIANNSIAAASAVADTDYGNVSAPLSVYLPLFHRQIRREKTFGSARRTRTNTISRSTEHHLANNALPFTLLSEFGQFQSAESADFNTAKRLFGDVQRVCDTPHAAHNSRTTERQKRFVGGKNDADWGGHLASELNSYCLDESDEESKVSRDNGSRSVGDIRHGM